MTKPPSHKVKCDINIYNKILDNNKMRCYILSENLNLLRMPIIIEVIRMKEKLFSKDYVLLWLGMVVSQLGAGAGSIGLMWWNTNDYWLRHAIGHNGYGAYCDRGSA